MSFFRGIIGHANILRLLDSSLAHPASVYLFSGPTRVGKRTIAEQYLRGLLDLPVDDANWHAHPDVIVLEADEGKKNISVEQVREMKERLSLRPMKARRTVAYLPTADRLNEAGTNALLKVLEEPPAGAVFLFVVEQLGRLPETVLSRSAVLKFSRVADAEMRKYFEARNIPEAEIHQRLAMASGCPGRAIEPPVQEDLGKIFIDQIFADARLGQRLYAIEILTKACEGSDDDTIAWREALQSAMECLKEKNLSHPLESQILGAGLIQAFRFVGSSVSPRLALEAAAARMAGEDLTAEAKRLLPTHLPRLSPLIYG